MTFEHEKRYIVYIKDDIIYYDISRSKYSKCGRYSVENDLGYWFVWDFKTDKIILKANSYKEIHQVIKKNIKLFKK